jgi:cytochrome c biogenesis protein CcmG, thiol:disulfide interchange protein DsbE
VIRALLIALPLVVLVGLVALFASTLNRDPSYVASVLIDKPVPPFDLPPIAGLNRNGLSSSSLEGQAQVVNVFASWCIPCRAEHPLLLELKRQSGVPIVGINQRDAPEDALAFLEEYGIVYDAVGSDRDGRVSIDWGVYGVPETFVVNPAGIITYRHVGPITEESLVREVLPAIEAAKTDWD